MSFSDWAAPIGGFVVGGPAGAVAADQVFNGGSDTKAVAGAAGDAVNGYLDIGKNGYQAQPVNVPYPLYGGSEHGAYDMSLLGQQGMRGAQKAGDALYGQGLGGLASASYGAQENPLYSSNEAYSRGYDQAGGLQLDREAAIGMAPSQAAYLMQNGLNQAVANQYATMGGARGNSGIALAQGNAGANIANLQNQAYTQASAQRAAEMANARSAYNNDAQAMRQQDQARLGQASQMSTFNVDNARQAAQTALTSGLGYGNLASNYYGQAQQPYNQQLGGAENYANDVTQAGTGAQGLNAGIAQSNADARAGQLNTGINTIGGFFSGVKPTGGGGLGGSTPKV